MATSRDKVDRSYICPQCERCVFHRPEPMSQIRNGRWCRIMQEPSHMDQCGLFIDAKEEACAGS